MRTDGQSDRQREKEKERKRGRMGENRTGKKRKIQPVQPNVREEHVKRVVDEY